MATKGTTVGGLTVHSTRYPELGYARIDDRTWQFLDLTDAHAREQPAQVGPHYRTKAELLADLSRYAALFGCGGAEVPSAGPLIDWQLVRRRIEEACGHYEDSAPTVGRYLEDLYERLNERPDDVRASELVFVANLVDDGQWMHPNYAANACYKLMSRLGMDTTGHAGF